MGLEEFRSQQHEGGVPTTPPKVPVSLTIDTKHAASSWKPPRQEQSPRTPSTSRTFGNPGRDSVQLSRYTLVGEALTTSVEHLKTPASPQELQIRSLEHATRTLTQHALDAQRRAADLRVKLSNRESLDPQTLESLQKERWLQEKRQSAIDREAKLAYEQLESLTQSLADGGDESYEEDAERDLTLALEMADEESRRRRENLAQFLEASHSSDYVRQIPVRPRRTTMSPHQKDHRLFGHIRSISLEGPLSPDGRRGFVLDKNRNTRLSIAQTFGVTNQIALEDLASMGELEEGEALDFDLPSVVIEPPPPDVPHFVTWITPSHGEGSATIYSSSAHLRSKDEILAEYNAKNRVSSVFEMPDYASHLMENLIQDKILLDWDFTSKVVSAPLRKLSLPPPQIPLPRFLEPSSPEKSLHALSFSLDTPSSKASTSSLKRKPSKMLRKPSLDQLASLFTTHEKPDPPMPTIEHSTHVTVDPASMIGVQISRQMDEVGEKSRSETPSWLPTPWTIVEPPEIPPPSVKSQSPPQLLGRKTSFFGRRMHHQHTEEDNSRLRPASAAGEFSESRGKLPSLKASFFRSRARSTSGGADGEVASASVASIDPTQVKRRFHGWGRKQPSA